MSPPSTPSRFRASVWVLLALLLGGLVWNHQARISRILRVTAQPEWSGDAPVMEAASATGYAGGWRRLILPEHHYRSYLAITQAQAMVAEGRWRVRHLGHENAPHGRESNLPSPYGWWLAVLAWMDHLVTGQPIGSAVERAALYADPLLQGFFLAAAGGMVWRTLGGRVAGVVMVGFALWFPLAGNFYAGSPDSAGLGLGVALLGLLGLAVGLKTGKGEDRSRRFAVAGAWGGLGLWLDAPAQIMLPAGLLLGALVWQAAQRMARGVGAPRPQESAEGFPSYFPGAAAGWRAWAIAGAGVSLVGYLIEYAPDDLRFRLEANHPLYALAWWGVGEVLARLAVVSGERGGWKNQLGWVGALLAMLALPAAFLVGEGLLPWQINPDTGRVSVLYNLGADSLGAWIARDGLSLPVLGALLPLGFAAVVVGGAWRRPNHAAVVLLAGPGLLLAGLAVAQPGWWSLLQVAVLAGCVAALPAKPGRAWPVAGLLVAIPGLAVLFQPRGAAEKNSLTESELIGLIERDLAHRLSRQAKGEAPLVLAPPELTGALHYYAGIRGLGTFAWENRAGLTAAARIASATSPDEAFELIGQRGVTHIVMPGWDRFLDDYAGLGRSAKTGSAAENSFVAALHRWEQPDWLRPRAYVLPHIPGFEGQSVEIFEVVDPQDAAGAMSRMAEFFVETGRLDHAAQARQALRRYPAHVGALTATAMVDAARRESAAFAETVARLMPLLEAGAARSLPWDRRVSLAVVLATARKAEPAQAQLQQCVREATEARLRALPTQSLFQLLTLAKRQGLAWATPELERVAVGLLPPEARGRMGG